MILFWTNAKYQSMMQVVQPALNNAGHIKNVTLKCNENQTPPHFSKNHVCVAMGVQAVTQLKKHGIVPKNLGIGKLRQQLWPSEKGGSFLVSYDPSIVNMDYMRKPEIEWDIALAVRQQKTGGLEPVFGKYAYCNHFTSIIKYVLKRYEQTGQPVEVTCDLETLGLDPLAPEAYIISIAFSCKVGTGLMRYFEDQTQYPQKGSLLHKQIEWLLRSPKVKIRGANFKYDWQWIMRHWGIWCTNWTFDTLLVGSLLDENRINSLNMHTKIYVPELGGYDDAFNSTYDKSKMNEVPLDDLLLYGGGDVDADLRVAKVMRNKLVKDKRLTAFYTHLLQPSAQAFAKMEYRGMVVDIKQYEKLRKEVKSELDGAHKAAVEMLPARMKLKYADDLSLTRDVILRDFLFTKSGLGLKPIMFTPKSTDDNLIPSCAKSHLQSFEKHPEAGPFIQSLFEWKAAKKTMSTYIVGFLKHLRSDGKFHPTYMLHRGEFDGGDESGTVSGRSSTKDPAYQTLPKFTKWATKLRTVYIAPPGMVVLNVDFSQGELRITACLANEPTMIAAYKKGIDIHLITGIDLWNIKNPHKTLSFEEALALKNAGDKVVKEVRQGGKAGNFGLIYGMQAPGFQNYAWNTYKVAIDIDQATLFRDSFFAKYNRLPNWHDTYTSFAHKHSYVRSPLGRVRHLPLIHSNDWKIRSKAERQAINSPVQSTLSDMGQLALAMIDAAYPELWCFGFTHDALSFYVPEDQAVEWAKKIKAVMEDLPLHKFGWKPQLDFPVDCEVGPNLGSTEEMKLAA